MDCQTHVKRLSPFCRSSYYIYIYTVLNKVSKCDQDNTIQTCPECASELGKFNLALTIPSPRTPDHMQDRLVLKRLANLSYT